MCFQNAFFDIDFVVGNFRSTPDSAFTLIQATGLIAWASRVKCPARFVSHLHEICIYI